MNVSEQLGVLLVPVDDLDTLEGNPRRGDVDAVVRSYETFGQRKPIVARRRADGRGEVTAGNTQLAAARRLGWSHIAVVWVDDDDTTAAAWALADNRTSDLGTYDEKALAAYLEAVQLHGGRDLYDATGYDTADLARLLKRWSSDGVDDVPDPPEIPRTQPGDLWLLGEHRLLCGDSTNPDDVARVMAGERAGLMVTDPPYLVGYDAQNHPQSFSNVKGGDNAAANVAHPDYREGEQEDLYDRFIAAALPHLTTSCVVYQWHAIDRHGLVMDTWRQHDLHPHQGIVWVKSRPVLIRQHFMQAIEACQYGWRKGHQPPRNRRPPSNVTNAWHFDNAESRTEGHPTAKPLQMFTDPYTWHLPEHGLGFEPFSGSGTAIAAAQVTGRRCYAIELAPAFVDVACARYQRITGDQPTLELTGEPVDFSTDVDDGT